MSKGPTILAIDTATPWCTVALTEGTRDDGRILGSKTQLGLTHSRKLLSTIDMLMGECELSWPEIDALSVGLGPGSFTGLRIGLATAKGLAAAADLPLVGCDTLYTLALSCCGYSQGSIWAMLDARKREVYAAKFFVEETRPVQIGEKLVIPPQDMADFLAQEDFLVGDGAALYRDVFTSVCKDLIFAPAWLNQPDAVILGFEGGERFVAKDFLETGSISPVYVRKSDAELNLGVKRVREAR